MISVHPPSVSVTRSQTRSNGTGSLSLLSITALMACLTFCLLTGSWAQLQVDGAAIISMRKNSLGICAYQNSMDTVNNTAGTCGAYKSFRVSADGNTIYQYNYATYATCTDENLVSIKEIRTGVDGCTKGNLWSVDRASEGPIADPFPPTTGFLSVTSFWDIGSGNMNEDCSTVSAIQVRTARKLGGCIYSLDLHAASRLSCTADRTGLVTSSHNDTTCSFTVATSTSAIKSCNNGEIQSCPSSGSTFSNSDFSSVQLTTTNTIACDTPNVNTYRADYCSNQMIYSCLPGPLSVNGTLQVIKYEYLTTGSNCQGSPIQTTYYNLGCNQNTFLSASCNYTYTQISGSISTNPFFPTNPSPTSASTGSGHSTSTSSSTGGTGTSGGSSDTGAGPTTSTGDNSVATTTIHSTSFDMIIVFGALVTVTLNFNLI